MGIVTQNTTAGGPLVSQYDYRVDPGSAALGISVLNRPVLPQWYAERAKVIRDHFEHGLGLGLGPLLSKNFRPDGHHLLARERSGGRHGLRQDGQTCQGRSTSILLAESARRLAPHRWPAAPPCRRPSDFRGLSPGRLPRRPSSRRPTRRARPGRESRTCVP